MSVPAGDLCAAPRPASVWRSGAVGSVSVSESVKLCSQGGREGGREGGAREGGRDGGSSVSSKGSGSRGRGEELGSVMGAEGGRAGERVERTGRGSERVGGRQDAWVQEWESGWGWMDRTCASVVPGPDRERA